MNLRFRFFNSRWIQTAALMLSVVLFSGNNSENFQKSREDVQIESLHESQSVSEGKTFLLTGFNAGHILIIPDLISGYSLLQLFEYNTRLRSFLFQFSNIESAQKNILFFLAKTIPLCSDEDAQFTIIG